MFYDMTLFDKTSIKINEEQYNAIMQDSSAGKLGIKINGNFYNFSNISKVQKREDTKDNIALPILSIVEKQKPSIWRDCVMKNAKYMKDTGELPKYTVVNGEIIEKEYYWR